MHMFPGIPQLFGWVFKSTHALPTLVSPGAQSQTPSLQNAPSIEHCMPHMPQLRGSSFKSVQKSLPPQGVNPEFAVQPHIPLEHAPKVISQSLPHPPQFVGSDVVSMHAPPQISAPGLQEHWPEMQTPPDPHVLPQVPQLFTSEDKSAHTSVQFTNPIVH